VAGLHLQNSVATNINCIRVDEHAPYLTEDSSAEDEIDWRTNLTWWVCKRQM